MCGIVGFIDYGNGQGLDRAFLKRALDSIHHRGPDEGGLTTLHDGAIGIGMRRLSIIDVSSGSQPMYSDDGKIAIVFNGELYNYIEIREQLEHCNFKTQSDTEVFLRLYEVHGTDGLALTRGMFGAAIWDGRYNKLILIRDRFGKKPLYYYADDKFLLFGSEIKSILEHSDVPRRLNPRAFDHFLTLLAVPEPDTMFQHVRKLEPGHYLEVDLYGRVRITRYWQLRFPNSYLPATRQEAGDLLIHHMEEAIRIRLRSDVPLGVLLSGGVDSSALVALASRQLTNQLKTFSIGFDIKGYDEFEYSRAVAQAYDTDHTEVVMPANQYWNVLQDVVWHLDEPMGDTATVPLKCICDHARDSVKVLLSGEGSDEMLAGYASRYANGLARLSALVRIGESLPSSVRSRMWRRFGNNLWPNQHWILWRLTQPLEYQFLKDSVYGYYEGLRESLYEGGPLSGFQPDESDLLRRLVNNGTGVLERMLYTDSNINLPAYLLMKADKMSMAASIELRCPFLDHKFAEFCASLPPEYKFDSNNQVGKSLLKQALEPLLPHKVLYRPKQGFPVPIDHWLRNGLKETTYEVLFGSGARIASFLHMRHVHNMWDAHQSERQIFGMQLWLLILVELWMQRFNVLV